jgi:nucleotide-binding universal stress UspA family protein
MAYPTLMVRLQLGQSNAAPLKAAAALAMRVKADVIGIAVCQPMPVAYASGYWLGGEVEDCRVELEAETKAAEAEFRAALQHCGGDLSWRSMITVGPLADYVAQEMRSADLLITGVAPPIAVLDTSRQVSIGEIVMQSGRPTLVVPDGEAGGTRLARAVIGWKDTRETRRAVADAVPLLRRAEQVSVVEIAAAADLEAARARVSDVGRWLARHGIRAVSLVELSTGQDEAALEDIAEREKADLIVAGAYGHSRLREWALGGMTRRLILHPTRCSFLSH